MNKNTKIWLNYLLGAAISLFLLWGIYRQVRGQLSGINPDAWKQTGDNGYLIGCILLIFANTSLEAFKWFLLCNYVEPIRYRRAFSSYLAGVAFALVTPNRIGEYPGRILYLGRQHTFRYINISVLGITAQLWTVYLFGFAGLLYYNVTYPSADAKIAMVLCVLANVVGAIAYWRFEAWLPVMERIKWLRKFAVYGRLLTRVTAKRQMVILGLSLLRFSVFAAQYLFLLKWMNVNIPFAAGFCMVSLFFWVMAVIPSIALTELGIRGGVCLYLFHHFSDNTIGMLAATTFIWLLNLIIPSIFGSILIFRMKILK